MTRLLPFFNREVSTVLVSSCKAIKESKRAEGRNFLVKSGAIGRPKKVRYIQRMPKTVQFSPRGRPGRPNECELAIDEFEALKLADYQDFSQVQGAVAMHLSRASFGRILRSARKKVADSIVNAKTIKIRMGNVQIGVKRSDFVLAGGVDAEIEKYKRRNKKVIGDVDKLSKKQKTLIDKYMKARDGGRTRTGKK